MYLVDNIKFSPPASYYKAPSLQNLSDVNKLVLPVKNKEQPIFTLDELLCRFNKIATWTKAKKDLKSQITELVTKDRFYTFIGSKHFYRLTRFGETRKISNHEFFLLEGKRFVSQEVELVCLGQDHCVFMHIAARELLQSKANNS